METSPYNEKLHKYLIEKGYSYRENPRYDRYDHNGITVFYYMNDYIMIVDENGEPVHESIVREIRKAS